MTSLRLLLIAALLLVGCATYTDEIRSAQSDLVSGRLETAVDLVNELLDVKSSAELPADLRANRVLLMLERATLLQAQEEYRLSSRDMSLVDERMEWLDIEQDGALDIARYLYSDDAVPYRAPPYERLLLNSLNMLNFLALGDLEGAQVEARRLQVLESFFLDASGSPLLPGLLALGNYLSAATFEAARDYDAAARHYRRAWSFGMRPAGLRERLVDLMRLTAYAPRDADPPASGLVEIAEAARREGPLGGEEYRRRHVDGQLLVVVQSGLAPYKRPERIPIGLALTLAAAWRHNQALSEADRRRAAQLAAEGLVKWLNFPVMTRDGVPGGSGVVLRVDDRRVDFGSTFDVARQVEAAWDRLQAPLIASAITRLLTRFAVGYGTRKAADALARSAGTGHDTAGVLGWVAGLVLEGVLTAADTPDTRSWTTLPARISIFHERLEPGEHSVLAVVAGRQEARKILILPERLSVAVLSRYR